MTTNPSTDLTALHQRFVSEYTDWFRYAYCRDTVPDSHQMIFDLNGYGSVLATWADFATPNAKHAGYMADWLGIDHA
jgi:hypothetical protein